MLPGTRGYHQARGCGFQESQEEGKSSSEDGSLVAVRGSEERLSVTRGCLEGTWEEQERVLSAACYMTPPPPARTL